MKAVLLAGGRGERLAPLTDTVPKPLVRVLDTPVIEYAFGTLGRLGVTECAVTVCYRKEELSRALGEEVCGVRVTYFEEETPLGTAGAVRACESFLDEDFLVLSADALFDFDLQRTVRAFLEKGALCALTLTRRTDVSEFGLVRVDGEGNILGFSEKPSWEGVFSDLVNCGIYVCRRDILSHIPKGVFYDFSQDLFPRLLAEGRGLYGIEEEGYWCDIGSPAALYRCNLDALCGKVRLSRPPRGRFFGEGEGRSFLGEGVRLLRGARVERSVIGAFSQISAAQVKDSVLGRSAFLADGACVVSTLAADRFVCEEGAFSLPETVAGEGVRLLRGASGTRGAILAAQSTVAAGKEAFSERENAFCGALYSARGTLPKLFSDFYHLGYVLKKEGNVLFCTEDSFEARALRDAMTEGFCCAGAPFALTATADGEETARFFAAHLGCPAVFVYCKEGGAFARLFDEAGLFLPHARVRRVQKALSTPCNSTETSRCNTRDLTQVLTQAYLARLLCRLPELLGVRLCVQGAGEVLQEALTRVGAHLVSEEDADVSGELCGTAFVLKDRAHSLLLSDAHTARALLVLAEEYTKKSHFALTTLPCAVEEVLRERGVHLAYPQAAFFGADESWSRFGAAQDFGFYDPQMLFCMLLSFWKARSKTLEGRVLTEEIQRLPSFCLTARDFIFEKEQSARLFSRLWDVADFVGDGLRVRSARGVSHLSCAHGVVHILTEAPFAEAAEEFCFETEQTLRELTSEKGELNERKKRESKQTRGQKDPG